MAGPATMMELSPAVYEKVQELAKRLNTTPAGVIAKALSILELAVEQSSRGQILTLMDEVSGRPTKKVVLE